MAGLFRKKQILQEEDLPPAKRISTPAGQRLSTILENGDNPNLRSSTKRRSSFKAILAAESPIAESFTASNGGYSSGNYSTSVWSDGSMAALKGEKGAGWFRENKQIAKRGGWKRLLIILLAILACLIAIIAGVVVGLKKSSSSSSNSSTSGGSGDLAATTSGSVPTATSDPSDTGSSTPSGSSTPFGSSAPSTTLPADFPVGTWSFVTFLDTVQTDCTANTDTWTCFPETIYNDDPQQAMTTFNWVISGDSSSGYTISSTDDPFAIKFSDQKLDFLDEGDPTSERYTFQLTTSKEVTPSSSLTDNGDSANCYFNATTFQAYLYTQMTKDYPNDSVTSDAANADWPAAVRVEQVTAGGQDVPDCYDSGTGEQITNGLGAQDPSLLCSCLYKNWRTPGYRRRAIKF